MNTEERITNRWYADASAVQFLDLSVQELHIKKNITPMISALDLSAVPRIYTIPSWSLMRIIKAKYGKTGLRELTSSYYGFDVPNVPLIEIFGAFQNCVLPHTFFDDFSRYIFEKLETQWEPETMRRYLNHLRIYTYYTSRALFYLMTLTHPYSDVISFEQPLIYVNYNDHAKKLKQEVTPKLIKLLFDNICPDSTLINYFFYTVGVNEELEGDLLFGHEPEITDYILHHLGKSKINHIWKSLLFYLPNYGFRVKPENFRVHVNYGVENIFKKWWNTHYYDMVLHSITVSRTIPRHLKHFFEAVERTSAKPEARESQILRVLNCYFYPPLFGFPWYLKVQRIVWKTMPFIPITYKEMKDVMVRYFGAEFTENIFNELQNYFDGFETVLQPCTLSHFSRCVIRHQLNSTSQMPEGFGCLGLPNHLQSYLKLEL